MLHFYYYKVIDSISVNEKIGYIIILSFFMAVLFLISKLMKDK